MKVPTEGLHQESGPDLRVTLVSPGFTNTEGVGRGASPEAAAAMARQRDEVFHVAYDVETEEFCPTTVLGRGSPLKSHDLDVWRQFCPWPAWAHHPQPDTSRGRRGAHESRLAVGGGSGVGGSDACRLRRGGVG
ncbi:hypothetical protein [Streptomyces mayteni]